MSSLTFFCRKALDKVIGRGEDVVSQVVDILMKQRECAGDFDHGQRRLDRGVASAVAGGEHHDLIVVSPSVRPSWPTPDPPLIHLAFDVILVLTFMTYDVILVVF